MFGIVRMSYLHRFVSFLLAVFFSVSSARAGSYIRDAEVENTLRELTSPILHAADLNENNVRLFVINDPAINAFVAGGLNIFIHTGLILRAETPEMLIGVIAHEAGHIAGAHLSSLSSASKQASIGSLLSYVLGAAAAISGNSQAAGAIMSGGQNLALRNMLSHYRGNEQKADQAAISYMETANIPPHGMLEMFELLRRNEQKHNTQQDPYLRTHPLTSERIATMRSTVSTSKLTAKDIPKRIRTQHARMVAKLYSFLEPPEKTFTRYPDSDISEAAHLARAIAHFRTPDLTKALTSVDALIELNPDDAYAYDLKGQILFEYGKVKEASEAYQKANHLAPRTALILSDLGKAYIALNQLNDAVLALEQSTQIDDSHSPSFHQLAIAYGKQEKFGRSNIALAQEALLHSSLEDALRYAKRAKELLTDDQPSRILADDLITDAQRLLKEKKDATSLF